MISKSLLFVVAFLALFIGNSYALFNVTGRIWIMGGDFSRAYQSTSDTTGTVVDNLVYWDGNVIGPLATSINGVVRTVFMDLCQNLWIGGDFTEVDGVSTGPLAVRKLINKNVNFQNVTNAINAKWEAVGNATASSWSAGAQVYSLAVDCLNLDLCGCDVHIGGDFTQVAGISASNVAKWKSKTNAWDNFAGGVDGLVRAVYKSPDYTYIGGDYTEKFSRYSDDDESWEHFGSDFNGDVYALIYDSNIIDHDLVYVGGDFTSPYQNVAVFDSQEASLDSAGQNLNGTVYTFRLKGDQLYLGGDFEGSSLHYVATYEPDQKNYDSVSAIDDQIGGPVFSMEVCRTEQVGCETGSVFVASYPFGDWTGSAYYNTEDGTWNKVGGGVNGKIYSVNSAYTKSSATSVAVSFFLIVATIISAVALLL